MRKVLILATILVGTVLVGCSNGVETNNNTNTTSNKITIEEAKEIALKHANLDSSEVTFIKESSHSYNNIERYDIEFYNENKEYDYEINAATGEILEYDYELEDDIQESNENNITITMEQAKEIALKHANLNSNEVTFVEEKLDYDDNKQKYELEFYYNNKEYNYEIDANTGDILSYEQD